MNISEETRLHDFVRPFLYMLAFYVAVQGLGVLGAWLFHVTSGFGTGGRWMYPLLLFLPEVLLGLLFIRLMDGGLQEHGFTLKSSRPYILPAVLLGVAVAALYTVKDMLRGNFITGLGMFHPGRVTMDAMLTNGFYGAVQAFLLCGVMQEFISRRAKGQVRMLRWDVPLAGIAVSLIAIVYEIIPKLIAWASYGRPDYFGFANTLLFGVVVLIYSYWYDRSRSLAAPVIAGALTGICMAVFYYLAVTGPFLNQMR